MTLGAQPECNQKPGARRDGITAFESGRNGVMNEPKTFAAQFDIKEIHHMLPFTQPEAEPDFGPRAATRRLWAAFPVSRVYIDAFGASM